MGKNSSIDYVGLFPGSTNIFRVAMPVRPESILIGAMPKKEVKHSKYEIGFVSTGREIQTDHVWEISEARARQRFKNKHKSARIVYAVKTKMYEKE